MADGPLNIYEMHLGSWKKKSDGTWYQYDELSKPLAAYLKKSGYNYVEFMPISEHPTDESWGYQNTGFFAPTSRYGTPSQLKKLIDTLHRNGIGVILDYVPVHFAIDSYGLALYDGSALYEYPHQDVGVSEWGSYNFMHSRGEVRSFLQSAADYWLREYHFDGLRMDAISRIIYWQGDEKRGENGYAVDFIKVMNRGLKERNPGCILIAEDSTSYPKVTVDVDHGGLGFDYETLIAAFNFSAEEQTAEINSSGTQLTVLLNTDWEKYGGSTPKKGRKTTLQKGIHTVNLAPFSGILFSSC